MKTSENGLNLIKSSEGLRLIQYKDSYGKIAIGYGHIVKKSESFQSGITKQQAEDLLLQDVAVVENTLNKCSLLLNQNQYDALIDFGFNEGTGHLKVLISHGIALIPEYILQWNKSEGKVIAGLTARRKRELTLWNKECSK
jgi:lysozyme